MEPLFITDPRPNFVKIAQEAQMPTNEAEWPAALLGELYKQAPYIEGHYMPEVNIREKSTEDGYAIGSIVLRTSSQLNPEEADSGTGKEMGNKSIQVPFIIREFRLTPLDLIVLPNGEFRPQNRLRVRDSLFKPGFTDGVAKGLRWNTWLDNLDRYPMGSLGQIYLESMNAAVVPYEKMSSTSIFDALAPLSKEAMTRFQAELNDPFCQYRMRKNPQFLGAVEKVAALPEHRGIQEDFARRIPPTVIQIERMPGATYIVKRANVDAYSPIEEELNRPEAQEQLGKDTVRSVDESGMITVSTSPTVRSQLIEEKIEPVKSFGMYRVKTKGDGRQLVGWVFPKVVDLDGTVLPTAVFANGSENSVQKGFAGVRAGSAAGIISAAPFGPGILYRTTGDDAVALVPLNVEGSSREGEGVETLECQTLMGQKVRLHKVPGTNAIIPVPDSENEYVIPDDVKFLPLPNEKHVDIIEEPEEFSKISRLQRASLSIRYTGDDRYSLDGCGLHKVADRETQGVRPEQALFLSVLVGMNPEFAVTKLGKAREHGVVTVPNLHPLTTLPEQEALTMAKLSRAGYDEFLKSVPKPVWLVKEASLLGDTGSVDKVLSLGFINPHNVAVFLSYIPELERTQAKVCQLLFTSRLGGDEDLEDGAMRAMHGIENMLASLRLVGLEHSTEADDAVS